MPLGRTGAEKERDGVDELRRIRYHCKKERGMEMRQVVETAPAAEQPDEEVRRAERDKRADLLLAQITYLQAETTSIQHNFLAMTYIPLAFVGVMIYYAYASPGSAYLFLLLPFLFSWCIANLMKYTLKSFDIGGYIMTLEEELNRLYGAELFRWEGRCLGATSYSGLGTFAQAPGLFILYVFLIVKFILAVIEVERWGIRIPFLAAFAVHVVLMLCLTWRTWRQYKALLDRKRRASGADIRPVEGSETR